MKKKKGDKTTTKKLLIVSGLILILVMYLTLITAVEAVSVVSPDLDAASLSLSLFNKKTNASATSITGNAVDNSGNTIATVTVKANEEVGRVRDDFYGASINEPNMINRVIDTNCDGIGDTIGNTEWQKLTYLNGGYKSSYYGAGLQYYYSNTSDPTGVNFTGDYTKLIKQLEWDYKNNITSILGLFFMPDWLADNSSGKCTKYTRCPSSNYTKWNNIIIDAYKRLDNYRNITKIQIWNEPDGQYFEDMLQDYSSKDDFVILYNSTYNSLKEYNSNIDIIGYRSSGSQWKDLKISNFTKNMFINLSSLFDSFSTHMYSGDGGYLITTSIRDRIGYLKSQCVLYGGSCNHIYIDEWGIFSGVSTQLIKNQSNGQSDEFKVNLAYFYEQTLKINPSNLSVFYYHWDDSRSYFNCPSFYNEYPNLFSSVSEAGLDNVGPTYYPPYNVTKDFAHYHAGGNMIVNSSSNNNSIKSVASLNPQGIWHITVINTATKNINVNIDVSSTGVEAIRDFATGTIYIVNNGIANVGVLTEYDVKHYEGLADYEVEEDTPASVGGSSPGKNKLVSVENLNINPNEFTAIQTDTSKVISTSDIFANTNTNTNNNKKEKEEFYGPIQSEEDINDMDYKARTGSLSLAVSNNSYLAILIILLASIICTTLIISIIYRKKKREADKVKKLMDWVDKARALGYSNDKMKEMLAQYNWDKELVEKVVGK